MKSTSWRVGARWEDKRILKLFFRLPACFSRLQLGVTFQQSLVLGNTSHYPVNPSLMIGDYVTPGNGISPQTYRQWSMLKSFKNDYYRKTKQLQATDNRNIHHQRQTSFCNGVANNVNGNNRQASGRRLVFSSPQCKLRLSSAVRILHAANFNDQNPTATKILEDSNIVRMFGHATDNWIQGRFNATWEARWRRLRAVLSS